MSGNKKENFFDIWNFLIKFKDDKDIKIFQFLRNGTSYGATTKKPARVSIQMPIDICNNENRNLGEISKYVGIVMFIPKEKAEKFMRGE